MDDLKTRFLEAATRPFSHIAETRLAAQAWLAPRIPLDTPQLEEAIRRWKKADLRKSRSVWRYVFYAGIAVISAAVWISYLGDTMRQASALGYSTGSLPFNPDATRERVMGRLSESDRKLFPAEDSDGSSVPATADRIRSRCSEDVRGAQRRS